MAPMRVLADGQAFDCIEQGEFSKNVISSRDRVAIVLTQSWCPQWTSLQRMIEQLEEPGIDVWLFVYDRSSIFQEFMAFKENVLGNDQIPYIRYYRGGKFISSSNYVTQKDFLDHLKHEPSKS